MVSLDISDYAGFDILEKFQQSWAEIRKEGHDSARAVKRLQTVLEALDSKYSKLSSKCDQFFDHLITLHTVAETLNILAGDLGRLLDEFKDLEEILLLLESVCDEEEQVERILRANDENHSLRVMRQKEIEDLKVSLAKDHAAYLENLERERVERKQITEKAIHSAIWES